MTKEEFLRLVSERYEEIHALNETEKDSFYNYEKKFVHLWQDLGRVVFESNISSLSNDRRKKKRLPNSDI